MSTNLVESVIFNLFIYFVLIPVSIIFLYPLTFIFQFFTIYHPDLFRAPNPPAKHARKVSKIQEQVKQWNTDGRKGRMCTGRPAWQTLSMRNYEKKGMTKVCIDLEEIIEVDTKNKLLSVEPGLRMGTLTSKLLPMGWTIPVIPELESLTIGGCVCGAGLETSSHRYSTFADSCVAFEVILADGSIVSCSKEENSDIFYSMQWSHGTLCFLVSVTFPLIPAGKYVRLEYIPANSVEEAEKLLQAPENDFIEGIAFDKSSFVVMHGNFVNERPSFCKVNNISRWYKAWFYKHVESFLKKPGRHPEFIPSRAYYHRHQRTLFWEMAALLHHGNHPVFRFLLGWLLPVDPQLTKLLVPVCIRSMVFDRMHHLIQDFVVPMPKLRKVLDFTHETVEIYPLWLCPVLMLPNPSMTHSTGSKAEMFIDIGIYGDAGKEMTGSVKETIREFEKFALENQGFQGLYADNYLSREEFERMFDLRLYEKVRRRLNCTDAFPHAYDKISHVARKLCAN